MNKFFALVRRALQTETRQARGYVARFLLGGFILWTLLTTHWQFLNRGAPGLTLFRSISFYNYFFVTILGTAFFATSITEEKEERTLGLLKMAGVGPTALILGKWTPRMIGVFLLLSIQIPFTVLAITLGGILWEQISAVYVSLFAHLILMGSIGLLCSVVMATTTGACSVAAITLLTFHFLPSILLSMYGNRPGSAISDAILAFAERLSAMSGLSSLSTAMTTGFSGGLLSFQVVSNVGVGVLLLAISWGVFDLCTRNEKEAEDVSLFDRLQKRLLGSRRRRVWNAALVWKDYQLLGGGPLFLLLKFVCYFGGMLLMAIAFSSPRNRFWETLGLVLFWYSMFFIVLETAIMTTRLYRNELSQKTWASLILLPRTSSEIIYAKLLGGLSVLIPLLACQFLGVLFTLDKMLEGFVEVLSEPEAVIGISYFVLQIVLSIHAAVHLSITQKWAVWPIAVFLSGFAVILANTTVLGCLFSVAGYSEFSTIMALASLATLGVIIPLHFRTKLRLVELAAE